MNTSPDALALEKAHAPSNDPFWQESWYFNFADRKNNVYGLTRIGYRPSMGKADGLLLASLGGSPALLYPAIGRKLGSRHVAVNPPESLRTGGLEFRCQAPMETWTLSLHTRRITLNMDFKAATPLYMFPEVAIGQGKMAAAAHYEQAGRVTGTLVMGRRETPIDGWGQRDHSWGPRHWAGVGSWTWISAQFPSGWAFNHWSLGSEGPSKTCGFVGDAHGCQDLVSGRIAWRGDPKGRKPSGASLALTLENGSTREVDFKTVTLWPLYKDGAIITESFGLFTCNGETGVGVVERLFVPRLGPLSLLGQVPKMAAMGLYSR